MVGVKNGSIVSTEVTLPSTVYALVCTDYVPDRKNEA
jgi:hypothetical protein